MPPAVVKRVVEEAFDTNGSVGIERDWSNVRQIDHLLRSDDGGPGIPSLWLAVNDSVAAVVKLVVAGVFCAEKFFSTKSEAKQAFTLKNF